MDSSRERTQGVQVRAGLALRKAANSEARGYPQTPLPELAKPRFLQPLFSLVVLCSHPIFAAELLPPLFESSLLATAFPSSTAISFCSLHLFGLLLLWFDHGPSLFIFRFWVHSFRFSPLFHFWFVSFSPHFHPSFFWSGFFDPDPFFIFSLDSSLPFLTANFCGLVIAHRLLPRRLKTSINKIPVWYKEDLA